MRQQMIDQDVRCCDSCNVELTNDNQYESMILNKCYRCIDCHKRKMGVTNHGRMYVNGKYVARKHPLYKPGRYKSFGDLAFGSLNNYSQIKEGYVYAIVNAAWPEWVKIGKALDAEDRLSGYQTSSPMRDYKLIHSVYFEDRNKAETKAHKIAATKASLAWDKSSNGEWFCMTDDQAIDTIKDVANES